MNGGALPASYARLVELRDVRLGLRPFDWERHAPELRPAPAPRWLGIFPVKVDPTTPRDVIDFVAPDGRRLGRLFAVVAESRDRSRRPSG